MKGGRRLGAGRPKGSPNKNQALLREYAKRIGAGDEITSPLEVLIETMRYLREMAIRYRRTNTVMIDGKGDDAKKYTSLQLQVMAAEVAAKAAPFVHPKLASVEADISAKIGLYEASLIQLANEAQE